MITKQELQKFAGSRSWYQTIHFEDDVIGGNARSACGDPGWENIKTFLPEDLTGKRVIDLGCNAGIFCVRMALIGAEVVGVDYTGWRETWDFQEQQVFVKQYFEQKHNRSLPITYISGKMGEVVYDPNIGKFDYAIAIASIYYTFTPKETVHGICNITDRVILRIRDDNRIDKFTKLFEAEGYTRRKYMQECWWKKYNTQTDDFHLFLYVRDGVDNISLPQISNKNNTENWIPGVEY